MEYEDGKYLFEDIEVFEDVVNEDGNIEMVIEYKIKKLYYTEGEHEIEFNLIEEKELNWVFVIDNFNPEFDSPIDFSDEFVDFDVDKIYFEEGEIQITSEFKDSGDNKITPDEYELEIDINGLSKTIDDDSERIIYLKRESLPAEPEIDVMISGDIPKAVNKVEIGIGLEGLDVDYVLLKEPYKIEDSDEFDKDNLSISLEQLNELDIDLESILFESGELVVSGFDDILKYPANNIKANNIKLSLILPNGDKEDFIWDEDDDNFVFDFKDIKFEKDNDEWGELEIEIDSSIVRFDMLDKIEIGRDFDEDKELEWQEVTASQNDIIEKVSGDLNISETLNLEDFGLDDIDEILDIFSITADTIDFLIDLETNISEGLEFEIGKLLIKGLGSNDETINSVELENILISSGLATSLFEEEEEAKSDLADLIMEQPDQLKFEISDISGADEDKILTIDEESYLKADGIFELALNFEIKPDEDGGDEFTYKTETFELEGLDDDARDALRNNLKSVELVQEMVNQLDLVGKVQFFIGSRGIGEGDNEITEEDFFDEDNENYVYHSSLIDLREGDQKYLNEDSLGEGFIDSLTEEGPLHVGFKIVIPIDEEEQGRRISFSRNDRIELKMWSNVTVRVNSQD